MPDPLDMIRFGAELKFEFLGGLQEEIDQLLETPDDDEAL